MRKQHLSIAIACGLSLPLFASAQTPVAPPSASRSTTTTTNGSAPPQQQQRPAQSFNLADYGVQIQPEPRIVVMMAALEAAAGNDSAAATTTTTTAGRPDSPFRQQVRRDQANLDADLRERLRQFYERHRLSAPATPAEQSARYISLALALSEAPALAAPAKIDDLPAGVLEVLDFAALVREFYTKSGIAERLPGYIKVYKAEGERLRRPATEVVQAALSYLHTQPITTIAVAADNAGTVNSNKPAQKGQSKKGTEPSTGKAAFEERARRFLIVPDLLATPGAVNFRVIGDDYYVILPYGSSASASDLRRAYLQYLVDPLIIRFNRDIALRRADVRQLLDAQVKAGTIPATASPDMFSAVTRSLVVAADVRMSEATRREALRDQLGKSMQNAKATEAAAARTSVVAQSRAAQSVIADEAAAQLAEAYERGAVLAFYFAEQLANLESSGFDIVNLFADMIGSFDPAREKNRLSEAADARTRAQLAKRSVRDAERGRAATAGEEASAPGGGGGGRARLIENLAEVEQQLRSKNYTAAETRLRSLMQEFQGEPRIFFALGQTASLAAQDAFDEELQAERLNRAVSHYRSAIEAALSVPDTNQALISRSHAAMGRILAFLGKPDEAAKEFDLAIKVGKVDGGAYDEAVAGKNSLTQQQQ